MNIMITPRGEKKAYVKQAATTIRSGGSSGSLCPGMLRSAAY
jgi:hypothetical protein